MNPLTPLTFAACAVAVTLIADSVWVSAGMLTVAACLALFYPTPSRRPFLLSLGMGGPAFIGFLLMYAPFGQHSGWFIFTTDGTRIALELGLKFMTAAAVGLTIGSFVHLDQLMRVLQTRLPARLVYVLGSTFRLYPMARARLETIKQVQITRGVDVTGIRGTMLLILPLIVGLVDDAAQRARPLQRAGFGEAGPRTVLRPVGDRPAERVVRLAAVAGVVAVGVCAGVGII
ncbi:energy-coupling factor transporter transmembrane protein EcfT [Corynebacterium sp. 320]|uniref:energy-coupling factor transporter transmembrane component T n=1 Tax=Corynebacterium TaxID=1716 RepID=UPI00125CB21E|nr:MULTISPECIES: energy-coupling factor transporter transmembrane component T [Corynebacterium]KAB1503104.1 energy-coupling factor transporter transmembrane protein EcfT [Corynebacterium sp. 320]KAB1551044.1 energy-coupling factor transporter transmembrane protein EcfT [Corynebacterium sp. 319]KAB3526901.1 energy-coupling factor transporter transmembrane protein EcfT [Corynebacterium sp. 250]KAB3538394.1 energy-coupling factor transporter transmembrane protein EcfT [Corynebacterium sp. 366]QNP